MVRFDSLVCVLLVVLVAGPAHAATLYVAPSGDDAAAGTQSAPWLTLQHAADAVNPGDEVVVAAGNYVGFWLQRGGTASQRVTFRGEPGAVINAVSSQGSDCVYIDQVPWVTVKDLRITGCPRAVHAYRTDGLVVTGCTIDQSQVGMSFNTGDDIEVSNNQLSAIPTVGMAFAQYGARLVVRGNTISAVGDTGILLDGAVPPGPAPADGALVEANVLHDMSTSTGGSAIGVDGAPNTRVLNNVVWAAHAGGIAVYQIDGTVPSTGAMVVNNSVAVAPDGRWCLSFTTNATGGTVRNNLLFSANPLTGSLKTTADSAPGLSSDFNGLTDALSVDGDTTIITLAQWQGALGQDGNSLTGSPALFFANFLGNDLHLFSGSLAVDRGSPTLAPPGDADGLARPVGAGFDLGAYEFCPSPPCALAPVPDAGVGRARGDLALRCGCGQGGGLGLGLLAAAVLRRRKRASRRSRGGP